MTTSSLIDLASLPVPDVLEVIDFEAIYIERKAALVALWPDDEQAEIAATVELESEPLARLLQENCYREITLRQRINDAARAVMLAYAEGNDLTQRAALFNLQRLVVTPATSTTAEVDEDDEDLRRRIQLAPQGFSVAGPSAAYVSKALAVDGTLLDAKASNPEPGDILVSLLSKVGDGTVDQSICDAVLTALSAEDQRPLSDTVSTQSAEIVRYRIVTTGYTKSGVGSDVITATAQEKVQAYADSVHRVGARVATSGIIGAMQAAGFSRTVLTEPAADMILSDTQASYCYELDVLYGGVDG